MAGARPLRLGAQCRLPVEVEAGATDVHLQDGQSPGWRRGRDRRAAEIKRAVGRHDSDGKLANALRYRHGARERPFVAALDAEEPTLLFSLDRPLRQNLTAV